MKKTLLFLIVYFFSIFGTYCQYDDDTLDSTKIQQLSGLCKVWGFLKYYHPEIQKGKIDWDTTLILYIPEILKASDNEEYNKIINRLIILPGKVKKLNKPYKYLPKDTSYNNFDYAWINNNMLFISDNSKLLFDVIENYKPRKNVYFKKELNTRYSDNEFYKYNDYFPDTTHTLLALYRYWNVINYFFAYKKITDENWNDVLIEFIPKILQSSDKRKFYFVLAELITKINDCHGFFYNYNFSQKIADYDLPIKLKYIDNKTIISEIPDSLPFGTNLKKGDIILKINWIDINEKRKELKKYCGCSHQYSIDREINYRLLNFPFGQEPVIEVLDSNNTLKTDVFNKYWITYWYHCTKKEIKWEKYLDNIGYVNLEYISMKDIRKAFKELKNTKALIFDLRNNSDAPLIGIALRLPKVSYSGAVSSIYCIGKKKYPGTFKITKQKDIYFGLKTFHKKYKGKVIFLINENVQSTYEMQLMEFKADYDITLIGSNTAGSFGRAFSFLIQKNFLTFFTWDAIFWPDGSQTQRIGINPDIYIIPTIKGIREHRDEVLERAIEFIKT